MPPRGQRQMNAGLNKAQCDLHHVDGEGPSLRAIVPTPFPLPWSPVHVILCLPPPHGWITHRSSSFILCISDQHVQKDAGWSEWAFRCLDWMKPIFTSDMPEWLNWRTPHKAASLLVGTATGQTARAAEGMWVVQVGSKEEAEEHSVWSGRRQRTSVWGKVLEEKGEKLPHSHASIDLYPPLISLDGTAWACVNYVKLCWRKLFVKVFKVFYAHAPISSLLHYGCGYDCCNSSLRIRTAYIYWTLSMCHISC